MAIRVYELARELKVETTSLINKLEDLDIYVKSHASTITDEQALAARNAILGPNPQQVVEQRLQPGVIRRRAKASPKVEEESPPEQQARWQPDPQVIAEAAEKEKEEPKQVEAKPAHEHAAAAKEKPAKQIVPQPLAHQPPAQQIEPSKPPVVQRQIEATPEKPITERDGRPPRRRRRRHRSGGGTRPAQFGDKAVSGIGDEAESADRQAAVRPVSDGVYAVGASAQPRLILKSRYIKPELRRESGNLLQKVDEEKEAAKKAALVEKARPEEDKDSKKKNKKKKTLGKDKVQVVEQIKEELPPVKKVVKKGATRRRETITRQDFLTTQDNMYKPLRRKKKGMPKKMMKKTALTTPKAQKRIIRISGTIQVAELARRMGIKAYDLLKKLMDIGVTAHLSRYLDFDEALLVAGDYGYEVENVAIEEESLLGEEKDNADDYIHRAPIVTVMGHVDHGKTTLLDAIRKTNVVDSEKGGITQHIGAYTVKHNEHEITFIDTPGHEAFTAMRSRGAKVTDIVILVVAADDGVMDRTREAINHAKDAGVPIIVAVNKIDKPEADQDRVKRQLAEVGLTSEDWGGDTMFVPISAKKGTGVEDLLASILVQAEVLELTANPKLSAKGAIVEARMDKGHGPIATALVEQGTLQKGDIIVAGTEWGRVRLMLDAGGNQVKDAIPAHAVAIIGFSTVPQAGDAFNVVKDEKTAKQVIEHRVSKQKEIEVAKSTARISFDELYQKLQSAEGNEFKVIVKADVQGSVEAVTDSLRRMSSDKCKLTIIHSGTGPISESDVMLASASGAWVIGFTVKPDSGARKAAEQEKVQIKTYDIIYELLDDVRNIMEGTLEPDLVEQVLGHAEVRNVFGISKVGKIAGSYVADGKITRSARVRVLRKGAELWKGKISNLKRFKDDAREVAQGNECGIRLDGFDDLQEGDVIEAFVVEEIKAKL